MTVLGAGRAAERDSFTPYLATCCVSPRSHVVWASEELVKGFDYAILIGFGKVVKKRYSKQAVAHRFLRQNNQRSCEHISVPWATGAKAGNEKPH
jgi:hypothetical protein